MNNTAMVDIFNMFHDGDFVSLERNNQDVGFQIEIQFLAELVQPDYTFFRGILKNCQICQFKRWEDTETIIEDIEVINALIKGMEILRARLDRGKIAVNCQGMKNENRGGDFIFACDDIELFDQGGRFVTEEELQVLSQKFVTELLEEQIRKIQ